MTLDPALLAAVAAAPDDDLPRLVAADWLDDHGHPDHAEFIRAQVRLATTDPWEPFAVLCRHRRTDWLRGDRWRDTLPRVDGSGIEWQPDRAFRRGFGWALIVRDVRWLLAEAPRLFAEAPVGELHLPTATLDEWRAFAKADWLPRVKAVHFYGTTTPVEPVRELIASPLSSGIEEIVFEKASGDGLPVLLEDLFESSLGGRLLRLEFLVGPHDSRPMLDALRSAAKSIPLRRLALRTFSPPDRDLHWLYLSRLFEKVTDLDLVHCPGSDPPWLWRAADDHLGRFSRLRISGCGNVNGYKTDKVMSALRSLDLSDDPLDLPADIRDPYRLLVGSLPELRSLTLRRTQFRDVMIEPWTALAPFWPNLVELDLRDNRITDAGAKHLLEAPIPSDLTALLLDGNPIGDGMRDRLRGHFGDRVIV